MNQSIKNSIYSGYNKFCNLYDYFESGIATLGLISLALIMVMTTGNAVARYVIDDPISGTYELIELYLMPMVIFLYAARLEKNNGNINVDILYTRLPDEVQSFINLIGRVLAFIIFGAISYIAGVKFWDGFIEGRTSVGVVEFPIYISWLIMAVGLFALAIRLVIEIRTNLVDLYTALKTDTDSEVVE